MELAARLLLGGIFVYSSYHKIISPAAFAKIIYGYLLFPAFTARPWALGMKQFYIYSVVIGAVAAFFGSIASFMLDWPLAPTEVVVAFIFLILSRIGLLIKRTLTESRQRVLTA